MTRLPVVSGAEIIKALERAGFAQSRSRGSHVIMRHPQTGRGTTVPLHQAIKRGTLAAILRQLGMDAADFLDLL